MRVLVVDQDSEVLEAIARAFEVDVATSKATCIDLLRANAFDVLIACERLADGSGLELLSQVAKRWPKVVRVLAIEPSRRAMLKGRLGPFKLFDTISYPVLEEQLEAVLERLGAEWEEREDFASDRDAIRSVTAPRSSDPRSEAVKRTGTPSLPRLGSKIVPLGTAGEQFRILPRDDSEREAPPLKRTLVQEKRRQRDTAPTFQQKAAALAAEAVAGVMGALNRFIKPQIAGASGGGGNPPGIRNSAAGRGPTSARAPTSPGISGSGHTPAPPRAARISHPRSSASTPHPGRTSTGAPGTLTAKTPANRKR